MAKYACKACGAELYFDPKRGKLHCEYCGSDFDPSEYALPEEEAPVQSGTERPEEGGAAEAQAVTEEADEAGSAQSTDDSEGELVVYHCPNCGADVITARGTAATTCVYCNKAVTMEGNLRGVFKPDCVLPFAKSREEVEEAYRALCRKSVLTPRLFTKEATVKKIKGMYIPYWLYTFDGTAQINMRGTNVRVWRSGDTEFTETSTYGITEEGKASFKDVPADALKGMDNELMDSIEPFDFSKMKPFNAAYLAGFYTQRWDDEAAANEPRAKARAKAALSHEVTSRAGKYTTLTIQSETYNWQNKKTKYAMLPVWMMYTEYKGKNYLFGMNGQTGKMMGELPKDPARIFGIAAAVFAVSQVVMMIIRVLGVMV